MHRSFHLIARFLLATLLVFALAAPAPAAGPADQISVTVDGRALTFDVAPTMEGGRVLVPLRAIGDALGLKVGWAAATATISLTGDGAEIRLVVGERTAVVNGKAVTLDVPARIVGGRTLVPARFISEATGAAVQWDGTTRTVIIGSALPAGWAAYSQAGLSFKYPNGWQAVGQAGMAGIQGPRGEGLVIWPFFVPEGLQANSAAAVLREVGDSLAPGVAWDAPQDAGNGTVTMQGVVDGEPGLGMITWVSSPKGSAGYIYLMGAPSEEAYRQATDTFARIISSVRVVGAPESGENAGAGEAVAPTLSYETWSEPKERAFTLEIPQGWKATGGVIRPALMLVQVDTTIVSPDDEIQLWMGDHHQLFTEPNPVLQMGGLYQGGTYQDPSGYGWRIEPYAAGEAFIRQYFLPAKLGQVEVTAAKALPELTRKMATIGNSRYDAGEVSFRTEQNGVPYVGWALAVTERIDVGTGMATWHLWRLYMYMAPQQRQAEAEAALQRLAESFAIDQEWAQMQAKLTAAQSQIITEAGHAMSETISATYENKARTDDELSRRRENANLSVVDVVDPDSGGSVKVENGANYYWVNNQGQIVGTQTDTSPGLDFRGLIQLP